jgi:hypothetical protein
LDKLPSFDYLFSEKKVKRLEIVEKEAVEEMHCLGVCSVVV